MDRPPAKNRDPEDVLARLHRSAFRARFKLSRADVDYVKTHGLDDIRAQARDIISRRIAPAHPEKDGRQTPWKGHPVYVAQQAVGACCRKCLANWHGIERGRPLTEDEVDFMVDVIMRWISNQVDAPGPDRDRP